MFRSITLGVPLFSESVVNIERKIVGFERSILEVLNKYNIKTRTLRVTLPPLTEEHMLSPELINPQFSSLSKICDKAGIRWFCAPLNLSESLVDDRVLSALFDSFLRQPKMFINFICASENVINLNAATQVSSFIKNVSLQSNNGFDNFRLGVSANCDANFPFFPFSYHTGENYKFSVALETTMIAQDILVKNPYIGIEKFQNMLIQELVQLFLLVENVAQELADSNDVEYVGLDASFAPFPSEKISVIRIFELLGVYPFGAFGGVYTTAVLTDSIKTALKISRVKHVGFNGVMFSVLEDHILAKSCSSHRITISDLISYSTVCACGVDMVPLAGITDVNDISSLILDIAALAVRLDKPLGVRVLPIPNKRVNEETEFNLDFLCDSKVMEVRASYDSLKTDINLYSFKKDKL